MEVERWTQVKPILSACLDLDQGERAAYLTAACKGDDSLLADVQNMLASNAALGDFLETPAIGGEAQESGVGRQVGNYILRELIGEGGMGDVFRAVRTTDFEKNVAIKLVKRGMDTDFILRRFRQERQILAALNHPNIAHLLDGGATSDGRPYLVMEYVDGEPITRYCEQHQISIPARLELFRTVCSAVQFAHQNLVVHRDLKPGNILVTAGGQPKLLDFGIAKLLEPEADTTMTSLRLLTPECASPEQVRGEPVTTATDIYSLGTLLYQLLTGVAAHQFSARSAEEVRRVVCEEEPKKPSTLRPVPGDLDNIVLKAMHKDPGQRYFSAEGLSDDVRRFLEGLPVSARRDTLRYRASKFIVRHKAGSAAVALIAISLLGGMAATLREAQIASSERARAERRFDDVRDLANSLLFDLNDAIQPLNGSTPARKLLVDGVLKYLSKVAQDAGGDLKLQEELALAYRHVGDVQGSPRNANLGDSNGALASYSKSLAISRTLAAAQSGDLDAKRHVTETLDRIAILRMLMGNVEEALSVGREALAINQAISKDSRSTALDLDQLAKNYDLLGDLLGGTGATGSLEDPSGALENHRKALDICLALVKRDPSVTHYQDLVSVSQTKIGDDLVKLGLRDQAVAAYRQALPWWESLSPKAAERKTRQKLATLYSRMGDAFLKGGSNADALKYYRLELSILDPLFTADPKNAWFVLGVADSHANVGSALARTGKPSDGLASLGKAIGIMRQLVSGDPANGNNRGTLALFTIWMGSACQASGDLREALLNYRTAHELFESVFAAEPRDMNARINSAASLNAIGGVLIKQSKQQEADDTYRNALILAEALGSSDKASEAARYTLADTYAGLGDAAALRGSRSEARSWFDRSLAIWSTTPNPGAMSPNGFFTGGPNQVRLQLTRITAR